MDETMKTTLKWLTRTAKITSGLTAAVLSGGAGGDTVVDAISVSLTSSQLLTELIKPDNAKLMAILNLDFKDGPLGIERRIDKIYPQLTSALLEQLDNIFELVSKAFADWMSAFIPDDGGITGIFIEDMLMAATNNTYDVLKGVFGMLPENIQELFTTPEKMEQFLRDIIETLKKTATPEPSYGAFGMIPLPIPAILMPNPSSIVMDRVINLLQQRLDPAIPLAVSAFSKIVPIVFGFLYIKKLVQKIEKQPSKSNLGTILNEFNRKKDVTAKN